jgi:hypothetical protein
VATVSWKGRKRGRIGERGTIEKMLNVTLIWAGGEDGESTAPSVVDCVVGGCI